MRKYTINEIKEILDRHSTVNVAFGEKERELALGNPSLDIFKRGLDTLTSELSEIPTPAVTFTDFRRFEEDGNRKIYEDLYFQKRQKLLAYAVAYWLYRDEKVLALLQDVIFAILDEYTWALPAHLYNKGLVKVQCEDTYCVDLFAAETADALAETVSLLGDDLHPLIKTRIHREIERRVLSRAYANDGEFFWHHCTNNWSSVCSCSVGMAAIYEVKDTERLAYFIEKALLTLENFYRGFSLDGVCLEGLGYWDYGVGYFMYFADMLYRRTEGEINLFDDEHVKNFVCFYTKMFFKGTRTVSFSDGSTSGRCSPSAVSIIKKYYPDYKLPGAQYIGFGYSGGGCARFARTMRDAVYTLYDLKSATADVIGTYILEDAQWFISSSETGVGFAAKAGNNDEPHNHNDIGSFLLYKNGEQMIADIGSGLYTKQYFESGRYEIFCNSSRSHSVPIINGEYQKAGKNYKAKDVSMTERGITADISGAYAASDITLLKRTLDFDKVTGELKVLDNFTFNSVPQSVIERFVASQKPEIFEDRVEIVCGKEKTAIYYDASRFTPSFDLVIDKDHFDRDRETYVIDFTLKAPEKEFFAEFYIK